MKDLIVAELRDRYNSHNFDDSGKNTEVTRFDKLVKSLQLMEKTYRELRQTNNSDKQSNTTDRVKKLVGDISKATIGNRNLWANLGPIPFALSKMVGGMLKLSKLGSFSSPQVKNIDSREVNQQKDQFIETFESCPTIKKIHAYIEAKADVDEQLGKSLKFQELWGKSGLQEYKEQKIQRNKENDYATAQSKIFNAMNKNLDFLTKNTKLIVGGVTLGAIALVGLGLWFKQTPLFAKISQMATSVSNILDAVNTYFDLGSAPPPTQEEYDAYMKEHPEVSEIDIVSGSLDREIIKNRNIVKTPSGSEIFGMSSKSGFKISSGYGVSRTGLDAGKPHRGIDIAIPEGTPIYSLTDGYAMPYTQVSNGVITGYGHVMIVTLDKKEVERLMPEYLGHTVQFKYAHLSKFAFNDNKRIKRGELLGYSGSSGYSTGAHLHFEIVVDNVTVFTASDLKNAVKYVKSKNGASGRRGQNIVSVDPSRFFTTESLQLGLAGYTGSTATPTISTTGKVNAIMSTNNMSYGNSVSKNSTTKTAEQPIIINSTTKDNKNPVVIKYAGENASNNILASNSDTKVVIGNK